MATDEQATSSGSDSSSGSEEEMRKLLQPNATLDQILEVLTSSYSHVDGDKFEVVQKLDSYDDNNFLVKINSQKYLIKVSNGVESQNYMKDKTNCVIHLQNIIFKQLAKHEIKTSYPIPAKSMGEEEGETEVSLHSLPVVSAAHSPRTLVVRLFRWVEGTPMSTMKTMSIETLAEAGVFLGRICLALDRLPLGDAEKGLGNWYHAWDGKQTSDVRKFVHCITDEKRRKMVENVISRFEKEVLPDAHLFRTGILQADFNDANIIMNDGKVSGVIDFGDTVNSWRVLDVTISMAYAMLSTYGKANHSLAAAAAILRGFNSFYPLSQVERKHLRLLMTCRLACSVTLGAYSIQQNPENTYLLLHAEPGWKALEFLCQDGEKVTAAMENRFKAACEHNVTKEGLIDCSDLSFCDSEKGL